MKTRIIFGTFVMMLVLASSAAAGGKSDFQNYFSDAAKKVKATDNPVEKRTILTNSFRSMSAAIDLAQRSPLVSTEDNAGLGRIGAAIQEKSDELAGTNGYARVSDEKLNAFSDYAVQDMEQADQVITVSVVTLLLVLILVVLLVR